MCKMQTMVYKETNTHVTFPACVWWTSFFFVTLILWHLHISFSHPGCCRTPVAPATVTLLWALDSHPNLAVPFHFPRGYSYKLVLWRKSVGLLITDENFAQCKNQEVLYLNNHLLKGSNSWAAGAAQNLHLFDVCVKPSTSICCSPINISMQSFSEREVTNVKSWK